MRCKILLQEKRLKKNNESRPTKPTQAQEWMGGMKKLPIYFFILRLCVGALFVYSGYSKLMEPSANFIGAILGYQIVDARTASWLAVVLPWTEFVAGVFFILGIWFQTALYALWSLNLVFLAAISSALIRHIPIKDCGCFGEGAHAFPIQATLALDILLFAVFFWMNRNKGSAAGLSLDRWFLGGGRMKPRV